MKSRKKGHLCTGCLTWLREWSIFRDQAKNSNKGVSSSPEVQKNSGAFLEKRKSQEARGHQLQHQESQTAALSPVDCQVHKEYRGDSIGTLTGWQLLAGALKEYSTTAEEGNDRESTGLLQPYGFSDVNTASLSVATPFSRSSIPTTPSQTTPRSLESDYEILEELGRGGFGRVFKAHRRHDKGIVCVKFVNLSDLDKSERQLVSTSHLQFCQRPSS